MELNRAVFQFFLFDTKIKLRLFHRLLMPQKGNLLSFANLIFIPCEYNSFFI